MTQCEAMKATEEQGGEAVECDCINNEESIKLLCTHDNLEGNRAMCFHQQNACDFDHECCSGNCDTNRGQCSSGPPEGRARGLRGLIGDIFEN